MQQITKNKLCCSRPDIWQLYNVETKIAHTSANISFFRAAPPNAHHNNPTTYHSAAWKHSWAVIYAEDQDRRPPAACVTVVNRKSDYSSLIPDYLCLQKPLEQEVREHCSLGMAPGRHDSWKMKEQRETDRCMKGFSDSQWAWLLCADALSFIDSVIDSSLIPCVQPLT